MNLSATDYGLYGYIGECLTCNGFGTVREWMTSGREYLDPCDHCDGSGIEPPVRPVRVKIVLN